MDAPRRLEHCHTVEQMRAYWEATYERVKAFQSHVDPGKLTRPPRDPDERAFLEQHGGLGSVTTEKPNPPWAKGWPPRNPNRPLTEREKFADAVNAAWREELLDCERPGGIAVPQPDTRPAGEERRARNARRRRGFRPRRRPVAPAPSASARLLPALAALHRGQRAE